MLSPHHRSLRFVLLAAAVGMLACSKDSATGPEANLTTEEVYDALEAISAIGFDVGAFSMAGLRADEGRLEALRLGNGPTAAYTESIDESVACPNGGTTRMRGSLTVNENTGAGSIDLRQSFSNCGSTSTAGRLWVFNGDPDVRTQLASSINVQTEEFSVTGTQRGAFNFSSNGASGRCSIDLTISVSSTGYRMTGRVCGRSVTEIETF